MRGCWLGKGGRHPAIDGQSLPCHIGSLIGGEESDNPCYFLRFTPSSHRNPPVLPGWLVGDGDASRSHAIHPNPNRATINSHLAGQAFYSGLRS